jgi:hypothetical protein
MALVQWCNGSVFFSYDEVDDEVVRKVSVGPNQVLPISRYLIPYYLPRTT